MLITDANSGQPKRKWINTKTIKVICIDTQG